MAERIKWSVEKRPISELKPYDKNPRVITEQGLKELKSSMDHIGMAQPLNINRDNTILSGHARFMALSQEDPGQIIDVYVPHRELTPKEEEAVIVRMNKNIAGSWDFDVLANEFEIEDLQDWGFTLDDLSVMSDISAIDDLADDAPPSDKVRNSQTDNCPNCGYKIHSNG